MNLHALAVLEFPRVLDEVAGRAGSELGAARVRALLPSREHAWIQREHSRVTAVRSLRESEPPLRAVPLSSLAKQSPESAVAVVAVRGDVPEAAARGEVDLRGLRVDEMETLLLRALDDAIRADLPALRVIHGKGTGVLRERVSDLLGKDTRVLRFRLGSATEGGAGATVAELR